MLVHKPGVYENIIQWRDTGKIEDVAKQTVWGSFSSANTEAWSFRRSLSIQFCVRLY